MSYNISFLLHIFSKSKTLLYFYLGFIFLTVIVCPPSFAGHKSGYKSDSETVRHHPPKKKLKRPVTRSLSKALNLKDNQASNKPLTRLQKAKTWSAANNKTLPKEIAPAFVPAPVLDKFLLSEVPTRENHSIGNSIEFLPEFFTSFANFPVVLGDSEEDNLSNS